MVYFLNPQTVDNTTILEPIEYCDNQIYRIGGLYLKPESGCYEWFVKLSNNTYNLYTVSDTPDKKLFVAYSPDGPFDAMWESLSYSFTLDGKTVYYNQRVGEVDVSTPVTPTPVSSISWTGSNSPYPRVLWAIFYGDGYYGFNVTYELENCVGAENNPVLIRPEYPVTIANFTPNDSANATYTFNSGSCWIDGQGAEPETPVLFVFDHETGNLRIGLVTSDITIHVHAYGDPYQETDGESDIPGGGSISIPGLPTVTATSSGVIGLFAPSAAQMRLLADYMWTDFGGTATTTDDILKEIVQAIKRTICNPLDYIVGLNIIPSDGLMIGSPNEVRFGFTNSGVSMPRLTSQFFVVDCGTLSFDTLCGNTFLDYAPYSKFSIYLPYIGFQDVDANDFVGHTIGVVYHGDVVTGAVTAYITKDGSVMYQYSGCCALSVPLNADGWGSTISSAVQIASSLITGAVSGGAAGVASSAISGAANVAANPSLLSPQVRHSGAVSGGAGAMGVQKPFVIREAVRYHSTSGFNTVSGYPSYFFNQLSTVHGFTVVENVHLHGMSATNEEIKEIENLLKTGVIL